MVSGATCMVAAGLPVLLAAVAAATPVTMEFDEWRNRFGRSYATAAEIQSRRRIFEKNVDTIIKHNKDNSASYKMGVNQFTDLTLDEFRHVVANGYDATMDTSLESGRLVRLESVKAGDGAIDWRTKGAVTPVKNQGGCGSCWAFSSTGAMEGAYQIGTGSLRSLSEQELVDCFAPKNGRGTGCEGGQMRQAFAWVEKNGGIDSELDYNYTGENGVCWRNATKRDVVTIDSWNIVPTNDEAQLAAAVQIGPVSVAIEADQAGFQHYKSGVFNGPCGTKVDHGVLVVGLTPTAYIVKNSWGSSWGMQGYLMMQREISNKTGLCGIAMQASYPVKKKANPAPLPPRTPGERPGLNHFCGCPADDGQCSIFGQHCCCYQAAKGDITCQQKPVTNQSQCCKPC